MSSIPYNWLAKIEQGLETLKEIPLWGNIPSFPLEPFLEKLKKDFAADSISLLWSNISFRSAKECYEGMGENPITTSLELPPISGDVYWIISSEDLQKLTSLCLSKAGISFSSIPLRDGFYKFLCLQILDTLETLPAYPGVGFKLSTRTFIEKEALSFDVQLQIEGQSIQARVAITNTFHKNWKNHFSSQKLSFFEKPNWRDIEVPLQIQIGSTSLSLKEWRSLSIGDFLILDRCSFDPHTHKGNLSILLENVPLFQGRFKDHKIKIIDYALYHEEETDMDEENFDELDKEEELPLEDADIEPEELDEPEALEHDENTPEKVEKILDTEEMILPIHVEIAKVEMSLQKLVQLEPGNLIELHIRPEEGVYLTVHGKKVAKAELVKMGELLGLKILEIGNKTLS